MSPSPASSISSNSDSESHIAEAPKQTAPEVTPESISTSTTTRGRPRISRNTSSAEEYPPGDARAMSPRRPSEETEALEEHARYAVREQARQLQLTLLEIAESIELVKADHDKLEKQNLALQDYIGGLTRSMSKGEGPKRIKSSGK